MDSSGLLENLSYMLALASSCLVAIPLGLHRRAFDGQCLLFGEVNFPTGTVTMGEQTYCDFAFYSSLSNIVVAAFLLFLKCCCALTSERRSMAYITFTLSVVCTLAWINCVLCTVCVTVGFTEWCSSVETMAKADTCQDAEKWDWTQVKPQSQLEGSNSYTYLNITQIASYCAVALWFIVAILSGRNFKQWILRTRAEFVLNHYAVASPSPVYYNSSPGHVKFVTDYL